MQSDITELLSSALRFLPEAVTLTEASDGVERIYFVNEAFEQLTGFALEEIKGQDMMFLQGPETDQPTFERLLHGSVAQESSPLELILYRKNRTAFVDRVSLRRIVSAKAAFCVQVHSDISRQKEVENLLILSQKREAAGLLVSGITHDFNNLLTAIMVYSGLMASKTYGDSQLSRYIDEIHAAAQRGAELVTQLLDVERQEAAEPVLLDPGELVLEMRDLMQRVLGEHIRLRIERADRLATIKAPQGRLQQVLLNLGINARDAMPMGGNLVLRLANVTLKGESADFPEAPAGDYVLLSVTDTGTGMDAETIASIFKPFFTTKARGKGSGLGLFTVETIVKQIGGHIHVESALGEGTTFRILLPANAGVEATPASQATLLIMEPADHSLSAILSAKGYRILFAATVDEALRVANSHPGVIEIMIASQTKDRESGPDLVSEIRKIRPMMKVLLKCEDEVNSRAESFPPGQADFLTEIATPATLVRKIEELLNQPSMP
ncbi:MAG: PAS domain-containing protein [Acidobacteriia bacterium]|nr:PAS domain-containing protein [Terriglobia bacterium]